MRPFGRLMDDQWQNALFTRAISDLPQATLKGMLEHVAHSRDGR